MNNLKRAICDLFTVVSDDSGVTRVITPLEYVGTGDSVVVRVRPMENGSFVVDENGEAAFNAAMQGGDITSDVVSRWLDEFHSEGPVFFDDDDDRLYTKAVSEQLVVPRIFRVAEAAQRLNAIATSRGERRESDFKQQVETVMSAVASRLQLKIRHDVELPIAGDLKADHLIDAPVPLLIIAASYPARLLEAEVIFMQYRAEKRKAHVWAIAESQGAVGRKHFERAGYYTDRTVVFQHDSLRQLVEMECQPTLQ